GDSPALVRTQPLPASIGCRGVWAAHQPPPSAALVVLRQTSTGEEKLDSTTRDPGTPSRVRSDRPTPQETVTVTVDPGRSAWVSVLTVRDRQVMPAEASAASAVARASTVAWEGVRARV